MHCKCCDREIEYDTINTMTGDPEELCALCLQEEEPILSDEEFGEDFIEYVGESIYDY